MKNSNLVWVDCEMTGLNPETNTMVEIAAIVTDSYLNTLDDGIDIVIHTSEEQLNKMDDVVRNMHTKSGLLEEIRESQINLKMAEELVMEYLNPHFGKPGNAILAGNSVGTDRLFISKEMPTLNNFLHYRIIDVSSIKELTKRWYPKIYFEQPQKGLAHRALADIKESIAELQYYKENLFIN